MIFITKLKSIFGIPVIIFMAGILFSCVNDLDTIQKVTYDPKAPDEVTKNLEVFYTDSGYAKIRIFAALAETYSKPEHVTKLKDGLKVEFFDDRGIVVSRLTALYGEVNYSTGITFVKDSVQLKNLDKDQCLQTEELFWKQSDSTIYTAKNVVVKSPGKIVYGRGIETNQEFKFYRFLQPYGKVDVSKE